MNFSKVYFLRQYLVTNVKSEEIVAMEFSYDTGLSQPPRFFGVPDQDLGKASVLYAQWGGTLPEGHRRGSTVRRPE